MDTSDKMIDDLISDMRFYAERDERWEPRLTVWADTLHKVRTERNMLAYEKGGHSLWTRYAK